MVSRFPARAYRIDFFFGMTDDAYVGLKEQGKTYGQFFDTAARTPLVQGQERNPGVWAQVLKYFQGEPQAQAVPSQQMKPNPAPNKPLNVEATDFFNKMRQQ